MGAHAFLIRAEDQVCDERGELFFLDDIFQVRIFPSVGVLDGLETTFVEFHADGIRGFVFDGFVDQFFGCLRDMGCPYKDYFPIVLGVDAIDIGFFFR